MRSGEQSTPCYETIGQFGGKCRGLPAEARSNSMAKVRMRRAVASAGKLQRLFMSNEVFCSGFCTERVCCSVRFGALGGADLTSYRHQPPWRRFSRTFHFMFSLNLHANNSNNYIYYILPFPVFCPSSSPVVDKISSPYKKE